MLHLNTIDADTHKTLITLQSKDYLREFALAGGTNLALRLGHRKSIDLDLFSTAIFDPAQLNDLLEIDFDYTYRSNNKYMLFAYINRIKVDLIHHPFSLIKPIEVIEGVRLFSIEDICAMKLFAVTKRGSKKYFYDIFQLCEILGPEKLVEYFSAKYGEEKVWMMQMSLVYFEDADQEEDPELLIPGLSWEKVKKYMKQTFSKEP
jgi:predicted nucleotidyltransferase component of viral defense system